MEQKNTKANNYSVSIYLFRYISSVEKDASFSLLALIQSDVFVYKLSIKSAKCQTVQIQIMPNVLCSKVRQEYTHYV